MTTSSCSRARTAGKAGDDHAGHPEADKVIVDGVNMVKRHTQAAGPMMQGGIIDKEMPIHVSNVALVVQGVRGDPHRLPLRRRGR